MSKGSYQNANLVITYDTFAGLVNKVNQIVYDMGYDVLTTNASSTPDITTGNAFLNGYFGANTVYVSNAIQGGTANAMANLVVSSTLYVSNNVQVTNNLNVSNSAYILVNVASAGLTTTNATVNNNIIVGNVATLNTASAVLANITTANVTTLGVTSNATIANAIITQANITTANVTTLGVTSNATIANLTVNNSITTNAAITSANINFANIASANINTLYVTSFEGATNLTSNNLISNNATITTAIITLANVVTGNVVTLGVTSNATIANATVNNFISNNSTVTTETVASLNVTSVGKVANLTVNNEIVTNSTITAANVGILYVTGNTTVANITSNGFITANNLSTVNFTAGITTTNVTANSTMVVFNSNSTVNATVNATNYSGTANNALNLGGSPLATIQGQITGNAATAYTNAAAVAVQAYTNAVAVATTLANNAFSNALVTSLNVASNSVANGTWISANAVYAQNAGAVGGLSANMAVPTDGYVIAWSAAQSQLILKNPSGLSVALSSNTVVANVQLQAGSNGVAYVANVYGNSTVTAATFRANTIMLMVDSGSININSSANVNGTLTSGNISSTGQISVGNSTVNSTINSTSYSGTANNSLYLGGATLATIQGQITGNVATAFSNAIANAATAAAALYLPTSGGTITGNLVISGNLTIAGSTTVVNTSVISTQDKNIYLASGSANTSVTDGSGIVISNTASWLWSFGNTSWQSNVSITPTSNNTLNFGSPNLQWGGIFANTLSLTAGGITSTINSTAFTGSANNASYLGGSTLSVIQGQITGNAATAYANAIAAVAGLSSNNATYLQGYQWASPPAIGATTPNSAIHTALSSANLNLVNGTTTIATTITSNATSNAITQFIMANVSSAATYGGFEALIQGVVSTGDRHITKILVTANSSIAVATEYGQVFTNTALFAVDVNYAAPNIQILITPALATNTSYKAIITALAQ